ncbi:MAG: DNA helicase RecQ [Cytophagales bacterium]|nr:DNA helicase RecQ [Cytophagales bacterium]
MQKNSPIEILQGVFGYQQFRPQQEEIIQSVLSARDTLVLMPTGGGKSLCYQIPALVKDGIAIVISPLIALMKDQVDALRLYGIAAAYLNSTQTQEQQSHIMTQLRNGELKLLYLAPERLLGREEQFIGFIKTLNVSLVAVDEAHCISSWGHDFRPEYLSLSKITKALGPAVPTIALTATADDLTRNDIAEKLELDRPNIMVTGFNRPNIQYLVKPKRNTYGHLLEFLSSRREDSGIIYTLRRVDTEELAEQLRNDGFSAKPYHAGLERQVKDRHQEEFLRDETKIIVATIAFGMGIDKSNVRFVVHMDLPKNIEGYYQETGRAGRDGLPSVALMFYSYADYFTLQKLVSIEGNEEQSQVMEKKLKEMADYGDLKTCRRRYLLQYFGEQAGPYCGNCDNCLNNYEEIDATEIAQKALSAVVRLEQRFGANYVIDFLRGSASQKIWEGHKTLKTFGVGAELSKEDWRHYINELLQHGLLKRSQGQYPVLQLTDQSMKVLHGHESVTLTKAVKPSPVTVGEEHPEVHAELAVQLKELRKMIADSENVPAYVVFSDASLQELVMYLPATEAELERINGFGEVKVKRYGQVILEQIISYCKPLGLTSQLPATSLKRKREKSSPGETHFKTLELLQSGKTIDEIASARGLAPGTIESHLDKLIKMGKLRAKEVVSENRINEILKVLSNTQDVGLRPIKEQLPEDFSYGEIRMVVSDHQLNPK